MLRALFSVAVLWLAGPGCGRAAAPAAAPGPRAAEAECTTLVGCEAACHDGATASCVAAMERIEAEPIGVDVGRFARILERGCDGGKALSCRRLALLVSDSPLMTKDEERARALFERSCELGDETSCIRDFAAGSPGPDGIAPPEIRRRMERFAERLAARCSERDAPSCMIASALFLEVVPDEAKSRRLRARARELFEVQCLNGRADSCLQAAMVIGGQQLEPSSQVERLVRRGCELGDPSACTMLALESLEMPDAERLSLLDAACDHGRPDACLGLGRALASREDDHAAAVLLRAVRLSEARCGFGDFSACHDLARSLQAATLPIEETRSLLELVQRSCDRGSALTCSELADALVALPEPLADPERAAHLKATACASGYPFACPDPMAALGFAARLDVPILDRRSGLMWAPHPVREVASSSAVKLCEEVTMAGREDWRLPSRSELESLLEDGQLRPFARLSLPHSGHYLSSELDPEGARWTLDMHRGRMTSVSPTNGFAHCVRTPDRAVTARVTLSVKMRADDLEYVLADRTGRVLSAATIVDAARAPSWAGAVDIAGVVEPVDVTIAPDVEWALAARFLEQAMRDGLRIDHVVIAAPTH